GHQYNQVTLANGRVLMTGGINVPSLLGATSAAPIGNAEYYNPTNNTWTAVNMPNARALHSATLLNDGRVAVCGGAQGTLLAPISIANVDLFNPATNTWTAAAPLSEPRASQPSALLPDGTLVLFGGQGASTTSATIDTIRF
ncbi:MAG: kelch repeat-containing protein, partial [Planctomycetota bacterium]